DLGDAGVGLGLLGVVLAGRGPAGIAGEVAQARVPDQVADRENDGDPEQVDPPLRQRLVVLGEVAVPDVAGGFRGVLAFIAAALGRPPQQPGAADDVQDDQEDDVNGPEGGHGVFSRWSSGGMRAAASNPALGRGRNSRTTPTTKVISRMRVTMPAIMAQPFGAWRPRPCR